MLGISAKKIIKYMLKITGKMNAEYKDFNLGGTKLPFLYKIENSQV